MKDVKTNCGIFYRLVNTRQKNEPIFKHRVLNFFIFEKMVLSERKILLDRVLPLSLLHQKRISTFLLLRKIFSCLFQTLQRCSCSHSFFVLKVIFSPEKSFFQSDRVLSAKNYFLSVAVPINFALWTFFQESYLGFSFINISFFEDYSGVVIFPSVSYLKIPSLETPERTNFISILLVIHIMASHEFSFINQLNQMLFFHSIPTEFFMKHLINFFFFKIF